MSNFVEAISAHWGFSALFGVLLVSFALFFVLPAVRLMSQLRKFNRQLAELRKSKANPKQLRVGNARLQHLWDEYCETLHLPAAGINSRTGLAIGAMHRATVPAELVFNSLSVFEGRINAEFFKHLPGLLTGIGIIGTFLGLINGLDNSSAPGILPDQDRLIASVREAFFVSATAIVLAMLVTFLEKVVINFLHGQVERTCHGIDALYSAGAGEEYLARLVAATEVSATQAQILKDALIDDLGRILNEISQKQITAAAAQQAALQEGLIAAIDQGMRPISQGFDQFRSQQGGQITQGLQDSMAVFVDRLEEMLGGQVGQARDLQMQTLNALEASVRAFQSMAAQVGAAGENATSAITVQLSKAVEDMVGRQTQMNETMRSFVDELHATMTSTQHEATGQMATLLQDLGRSVHGVVDALRSDARTASEVQGRHAEQLSEQARETLAKLASEVGNQTGAIKDATIAMRSVVSELSSSVERNIGRMSEGASEMHRAAEQFTGSGKAMAGVFDSSVQLSQELTRTASVLTAATSDVQTIVSDYRSARLAFQSVVETLHQTVDTAKRDASMTSDLTTRLERAAEKLIEAQTRADGYLDNLNGALIEAHSLFSNQLLETVRRTNTDAHEHLSKATGMLASTIAELDGTVLDFRRQPAL